MEPRVVSVEPLGPRRLLVRFDDGTSGEVEFRESFFHGVFEGLEDPARLAEARCDHGFVEWPGGQDLAPDAMYEEIRSHGTWVLD